MFVTPDSIVPRMYDPQSLNRYAYCRNNPLIYIDPSGHSYGNVDDNSQKVDCPNGKGTPQSSEKDKQDLRDYLGVWSSGIEVKNAKGVLNPDGTVTWSWEGTVKGSICFGAIDITHNLVGQKTSNFVNQMNYDATHKNGPFTVNEPLTVDGLTVKGPLTVNAPLTVNGPLTVEGNLTVNPSGSLNVNGPLDVKGSLNLNGPVEVTGPWTEAAKGTEHAAFHGVHADFTAEIAGFLGKTFWP